MTAAAAVDPLVAAAEAWEARAVTRDLYGTAGQLAATVTDGREAQRPHLDLIDQVLLDVLHGRSDRVMIFMPPQTGKSRRVAEWGPAWLLHHRPDWRIGVASYAAPLLSTLALVAAGVTTASSTIAVAAGLIAGGAALAARASRWASSADTDQA